MGSTEHTLVALACIAIAFYLGRIIGRLSGYQTGYEEAVAASISAVLTSLHEEYNVTLRADVQIQEDEND